MSSTSSDIDRAPVIIGVSPDSSTNATLTCFKKDGTKITTYTWTSGNFAYNGVTWYYKWAKIDLKYDAGLRAGTKTRIHGRSRYHQLPIVEVQWPVKRVQPGVGTWQASASEIRKTSKTPSRIS